jgi:glycosyltransferase EpsD
MIKKEVSTNDYKIVHCHSPIGGVVCRLACRKARKKGTKIIYTAHGFHFFKGANWKNWLLFYPVEKLCSKCTDLLITTNGEDYNRASRWKTTMVKYVPGIGVCADKFNSCLCDREGLRLSFGFENDDFVLMSTGQISVRKNQEAIINAISKINNPKIKYLLVGTGELEDRLKLLVKELKLEDRVVFAGYRRDIGNLLHAVDAFVFPSLQEGLPVALMEAMAAGLPIVCSNIRGNIDLIDDGKGGCLVSPKDVDGFAAAILKIVSDDVLRAKMRECNLETIKRYDVSVVEQEMREIYSKVLN